MTAPSWGGAAAGLALQRLVGTASRTALRSPQTGTAPALVLAGGAVKACRNDTASVWVCVPVVMLPARFGVGTGELLFVKASLAPSNSRARGGGERAITWRNGSNRVTAPEGQAEQWD